MLKVGSLVKYRLMPGPHLDGIIGIIIDIWPEGCYVRRLGTGNREGKAHYVGLWGEDYEKHFEEI